MSFYVPKRAMFIVAHPDDIEFGSAGTAARWIKYGCEVTYVLCTSGDVGIAEEGMTKEQAQVIREREQQAAADLIGVKKVVFLREPDGMLVNDLELRKKLVREIRRYRPEVVIALDPTVMWVRDSYVNHPDHRAAGTATVDAVFPASGQPNLFQELEEEGLKAHKVRKLYALSWVEETSDVYIDITETMDLKIESLLKHESQIQGDRIPDMLREWAAERGKGKEMDYAEAYRTVTLISDEEFEAQEARYAAESTEKG